MQMKDFILEDFIYLLRQVPELDIQKIDHIAGVRSNREKHHRFHAFSSSHFLSRIVIEATFLFRMKDQSIAMISNKIIKDYEGKMVSFSACREDDQMVISHVIANHRWTRAHKDLTNYIYYHQEKLRLLSLPPTPISPSEMQLGESYLFKPA